MIVYPSSLIASAAVPLRNPRIGYQTWTFDLDPSAVTASSEGASAPKDAPLRPDTAEYWQPAGLPATWVLDLGASRSVDYIGIAGHTLGTNGCGLSAAAGDSTDFAARVTVPGIDANYASTPDSAANSVTGDLDLELDLAIDTADLPAYFLDFVGDFDASVAKILALGTFTRAGNTATRVNASGLVETVLANVMRQAFDPLTRAAQGFQCEEARTEYCLRNQEFDNAVWAKRTGSTITPDTDTAPDGTLTADTFTYAAANADEGIFVETAAGGNVTTACAVWAKAGSITSLKLIIKNRGSDTIVGSQVFVLTSAWQKFSLAALPSGGTAGVRYEITTNGAAGTIKLWTASIQVGAFTTSDIFTTSGTVTRNADNATVTDISAWFNASEGTLNCGFSYNVGASGRVVQIEDATSNEALRLVCNTTTVSSQIIDGGVAVMNIAAITGASTDTIERIALAYKANDSATSGNGASATTDSSVTLPTVDRLSLGNTIGGGQLNGYLRTFDYYASRRVNATLQDFSRQTYRCLASKWAETSNQRSWALCLTEHGSLILFVSTDGTAAGIREYHSVPLTVVEGVRFRIRVKLDIVSGADSVCTFQTSSDGGVNYTTLGTPVTQASVSGVFDSTAPVEVGAFNGGTSEFAGRIYQFIQRATLDGATAVHFDASAGVTDGTSLVSDTGETWTINRSGGLPARLINPIFGGAAAAPTDDAPILFLDMPRSVRYLQLTLTGAAAASPRIAVVYAGVALAMSEELDGRGFMPSNLSRTTALQRSLSRGGQFLGQGYRRRGVSAKPAFKLLDSAWYRANFDPFVRHARRYPYFFAWCPQDYPNDVGYMWSPDKDIVGHYVGNGPWMEVSWAMQGIGAND